MSSSGYDSSYEKKLNFLDSDQDPSTCTDREPLAPIAVECSSFLEPEFRKSKIVVTIEEKDDNLLKQTKKLETGKMKSTEQLQSLVLNSGSAGSSEDVNKSIKPLVREVGRYVLSTTIEKLEDDEEVETPDERSARLLFESKRKAHYLPEGFTHNKSHMEKSGNSPEFDYGFLLTPPKSKDKSHNEKSKRSKKDHARSEKSKAPHHRSEKSKARRSEHSED